MNQQEQWLQWLFCGEVSDNVHKASTCLIDKREYDCVHELQTTSISLSSKFSAGDLI